MSFDNVRSSKTACDLQAHRQHFSGAAMKKNTTNTKKQNRKALRQRRAKRRFSFLKQLRRDTSLSPSAKMVVWALADDFYNLDDEQCNAGFTTLGHAVGRKRRSTIDAIQEAEAAGWITISSIGGGSKRSTNRYALAWEKVANSAAPEKPFSEPEKQSAETEQPTDNIEETVSGPRVTPT